MSDNKFHIEITTQFNNDNIDSIGKRYDCEMELRKWLQRSPIESMTFHGIENGICGSPTDSKIPYYQALDLYESLLNFQPLHDLSNQFSTEIIVNKPWNNQIKPYWYDYPEK
jgi:hypothetical protein